MTDNRTTEQCISKPLRGFIRHQRNRGYIDVGQAQWLFNIADEIDAKYEQAVEDARIVEVETSYIDIEQGEVITRFVPEQAIAATLGSGTLTAEQVREAIFHGSVYASYDGAQYYANGINMQAIADELNARAERTCEPKWTLQGETQTQEFWRCECGNCGHVFGVEDRSSFPFKMTIDKVEIPNFCPNCGARVVERKEGA